MFHKSTYRPVLEQAREDKTFPPGHGLSPEDYVLAGGGFPVKVKGVGAIGVIAVSGLPQRQDHEVIVAALCNTWDWAGKRWRCRLRSDIKTLVR